MFKVSNSPKDPVDEKQSEKERNSLAVAFQEFIDHLPVFSQIDADAGQKSIPKKCRNGNEDKDNAFWEIAESAEKSDNGPESRQEAAENQESNTIFFEFLFDFVNILSREIVEIFLENKLSSPFTSKGKHCEKTCHAEDESQKKEQEERVLADGEDIDGKNQNCITGYRRKNILNKHNDEHDGNIPKGAYGEKITIKL